MLNDLKIKDIFCSEDVPTVESMLMSASGNVISIEFSDAVRLNLVGSYAKYANFAYFGCCEAGFFRFGGSEIGCQERMGLYSICAWQDSATLLVILGYGGTYSGLADNELHIGNQLIELIKPILSLIFTKRIYT